MSQERSTSVVATLLQLGLMGKADWDGALQQVLEICCDLLAVERASYWSFCDDPPAILCELGHVRGKRRRLFERGLMLTEDRAPAYFEQIRSVQVLAVADVLHDPRTAALGDYFTAHDIRGLLDVPVFSQGRLVGILCHEHVGEPRTWTSHDSELALAMSHTLSSLLEARARQDAETAERRAAFLAQVSSVLADTLDPAAANELVVRRALPVLGDLCTLIGYDGRSAWRIAAAHVEPAGQRLLDELCARHAVDIAGPEIGVQALRERQSLLAQMIDEATMRESGLAEGHIELLLALRIRSVMAVLLRARGVVTGALTFASRTRSYGRDDLRFAEAYAQQVGTLLENTRLYAGAKAAIDARDEFLGLAGHELRSPLTTLQRAVEQLKESLPPAPSAAQQAIDTLAQQADRLSRLTELIMLAPRYREGALPLRFEAFDLAALVRDIARDFGDLLVAAGCELRLRADQPVELRGDRIGLEVVVSNLVANAMKFGRGAPLDVTVQRDDGVARLVVVDHGVGIPAERLEDFFCRYERAVSCSRFGGLGLGLHVTAAIVEAHGGTIRVESRPGEGAVFTVVLPLSGPPNSRHGR